MSRFEKQTPTPTELRRMLSKHSGEHAEKCTTYGTAVILVVLGALLPTWSGWLWTVSGLLLGLVAPVAGIILTLVALKSLFHYVVEKLPGSNGAGR